MLTSQRRQAIVDYLKEHDYADVRALSGELSCSPATIRRDLRDLEERGLISRTRGGAGLPPAGIGHEPPHSARALEHLPQKQAIAHLASTFAEQDQVVGLDVGSTTLELARLLVNCPHLTVFTSSLPIAEIFTHSDVTVVMVGGLLRKKEQAVSGPLAVQTINQFHFDRFFLGAAGISVEDGLTDFSIEDIELKKAFLARSRETIALADSSKLGRVSFAKICDAGAIQCLITDSNADPQLIEQFRRKGVRVLVAPVGMPSPDKLVSSGDKQGDTPVSVSREILVRHPVGLHARPASLLVKMANQFQSRITVENLGTGTLPANAKSILSVLALGVQMNHSVLISAEGADQQAALDALTDLIDSNFGETG